jgi:hypothetical protein
MTTTLPRGPLDVVFSAIFSTVSVRVGEGRVAGEVEEVERVSQREMLLMMGG